MRSVDVTVELLFDRLARNKPATGAKIDQFEAFEADAGITYDQIFQAYIPVQNLARMQKLDCFYHLKNAHFGVSFIHLPSLEDNAM